jgi:hypothetical protein
VTDDRKVRLLELYEARGDPDTFAEAKRLYEQALAGAEASDPETLIGYGYLLECHGRYALRQAVAQYERAIELDPDADKPHYQHIWAQAALRETEPAIARYAERLARSPTEVREHRFLANAYLAACDYPGGGQGGRRWPGAGPRRPHAVGRQGRRAGRDRGPGGGAGRLAPGGRGRRGEPWPGL